MRELPYTLKELQLVSERHVMDIYHRELMKWAIERIKHLESQLEADEKLLNEFFEEYGYENRTK